MAERVRGERGAGSVYQRKDGLWVASLVQPNGRRTSRYLHSEDEARRTLKALQAEAARGVPEPARERVGHYLDRWLNDVVSARVDPNTLRSYAHEVHRLTPLIGALRLSALTPRDVQGVLDAMTAAGLKPRTVRNTRSVLRIALNDARREGLLLINAAELARGPHVQRERMEALEPEQARAILAAFAGHQFEQLVAVTMATGLRQGEALGLRWADVDLDRGSLNVQNQLQRLQGAYTLKRPKTADSQAPVPLAGLAVEALRAQRVAQNAARLRATEWADNDLVFSTANGKPLNGSSVTHRFQRRLADAGLPAMRFHELRHGTATLLLTAGVPLRVVSEILRHSQIAITADLYAHVGRSVSRDAVDQLAALMGGTVAER